MAQPIKLGKIHQKPIAINQRDPSSSTMWSISHQSAQPIKTSKTHHPLAINHQDLQSASHQLMKGGYAERELGLAERGQELWWACLHVRGQELWWAKGRVEEENSWEKIKGEREGGLGWAKGREGRLGCVGERMREKKLVEKEKGRQAWM